MPAAIAGSEVAGGRARIIAAKSGSMAPSTNGRLSSRQAARTAWPKKFMPRFRAPCGRGLVEGPAPRDPALAGGGAAGRPLRRPRLWRRLLDAGRLHALQQIAALGAERAHLLLQRRHALLGQPGALLGLHRLGAQGLGLAIHLL